MARRREAEGERHVKRLFSRIWRLWSELRTVEGVITVRGHVRDAVGYEVRNARVRSPLHPISNAFRAKADRLSVPFYASTVDGAKVR